MSSSEESTNLTEPLPPLSQAEKDYSARSAKLCGEILSGTTPERKHEIQLSFAIDLVSSLDSYRPIKFPPRPVSLAVTLDHEPTHEVLRDIDGQAFGKFRNTVTWAESENETKLETLLWFADVLRTALAAKDDSLARGAAGEIFNHLLREWGFDLRERFPSRAECRDAAATHVRQKTPLPPKWRAVVPPASASIEPGDARKRAGGKGRVSGGIRY